MTTGFLFRFKILPYLHERILPKYFEILQTQNFVITINEEEQFYLKQFSMLIFGTQFDISTEINIHSYSTFFQMLEKILHLFFPIMKKIVINENERNKILDCFDKKMHTFILPILC